MNMDNPEAKAYLLELYKITGGDTNAKVSMYEAGKNIGMEKQDAGKTAEELFMYGYAEIKTLSGGIGITMDGIKAVQEMTGEKSDDKSLSLGSGPVLEDSARENMEKILRDIKAEITGANLSYEIMEEIVIDIKTIEVQMLSPNPKTEIIREILRSLQKSLATPEFKGLHLKIEAMIMS